MNHFKQLQITLFLDKVWLALNFALLLSSVLHKMAFANSTLLTPLPIGSADLPGSGIIQQHSGYTGNDFYYPDKKPPGDQGWAESLEKNLWLAPVLRYLITLSGDSVQLQADPVVSLLPVVLHTAASWWFQEQQVLDVLEASNETPAGDPFPWHYQPVDGGGVPEKQESPRQSSTKDAASHSAHTFNTKAASNAQDQKRASGNGQGDGEDNQPPKKKWKKISDPENLAEQLNLAIRQRNVYEVGRLLNNGASPVVAWKGVQPIRLAFNLDTFDIFEKLLRQISADNLANARSVLETLQHLIAMPQNENDAEITAPYITAFLKSGISAVNLANILGQGLFRYVWDEFSDLRQQALAGMFNEEINSLEKVCVNDQSLIVYLAGSDKCSLEAFNWLLMQQSEKGALSQHVLNEALVNCLENNSDSHIALWATEIIMTLLKAGASSLYQCPQRGYIALAYIFQKSWDYSPEIRDFAYQEMTGANIDFGSARVSGCPLIIHVLLNPDDYSERTVQWIKNRSPVDSLSLDKQLLSKALLALLNSRHVPERPSCFHFIYIGPTRIGPDGEKIPPPYSPGKRTASAVMDLISWGADCLYFDTEHTLPAIVLLADRRWDNFPEIRKAALREISRTSGQKEQEPAACDPNAICINDRPLMLFLMESLDENIQITTIPGVHFLMRSGLIPLSIDCKEIQEEEGFDNIPDVIKEINRIHKMLTERCGLKFLALEVILRNPELESDKVLKLFPETSEEYQPARDLPMVLSAVKDQVCSCLKGILGKME